ncbi:MAG: SMC-Scp complex subunit ScpB [Oligoflexia bacterium]|nr:SMC-Scp complex subunit ScpB [Oligoflexia bacterium]
MEKNRIKSIIESLLFVSEKPMEFSKICELFGNEAERQLIESALTELANEINQDGSRGIRLENISKGWQLRTCQENQIWIKKLENIRPIRLSPAALEVLAIIAYKQPVIRAEIDKIRGVDSSHLIKTLLDRNLIKINGRSDLAGRPLQYSTTPDFLEVFGLYDLRDLPSQSEIDELDAKAMGESGDFSEEKSLTLSDLMETDRENMVVQYSDSEEVLDELKELNKSLKFDIDLIQEKVDIIFDEACKKYATQRREARSGLQAKTE